MSSYLPTFLPSYLIPALLRYRINGILIDTQIRAIDQDEPRQFLIEVYKRIQTL